MNLFVAVSRVASVQRAEHVFETQSLAAWTICGSVTGIRCRTFNRSAMASNNLLVCRSRKTALSGARLEQLSPCASIKVEKPDFSVVTYAGWLKRGCCDTVTRKQLQ